jgi:hypothetical protein
MKRKLFGIAGALAVLLALVVLAGCDDGTTDNGGGNDNSNPYAGTWKSPGDGGNFVLVIRDFPQTFTITSPTGGVESGTWSGFPSDPVITLEITSGGSGSYNVSISGNTLSFGSRTYTKS